MTAPSPLYSERVTPSIWWWVVALVLSAMTSLMVIPLSWIAGIIVPIVVFIAVALTLRSLIPRVTVTQDVLFAGPAHIERSFITGATPMTGEDAFQARGQDLDARAFLVTRPWASSLVKVDIEDPNDPTPYWIVSTHNPDELARVLAPQG
ncbi:hypothetical protein JOE56_001954 [Brevibacterium paucivorans]|uniref:DUF3093 domain-containing protein n=1 Tax=Brevibacterium paucivorans TaxID=170994 RepID=A0A2N6VR25_9MICO|nr:DUF3093 domain-containing protein [Brevibacterium paucivorans]MBM7817260.1 hypothetical protein [Brevibacterium paucivorans]PMD06580.1 DUF3093 domain-containing protein [Brevibacterium paucivorans]